MSYIHKADMFLILIVLESLTLVDSYPRCICECWEQGYSVSGVCDESIRITGGCPYTCHAGYAGYCCQTAVDTRACRDQRNHCQNSGTCISSSTCVCRDGYTGRYCETNINECASNPCQHGGVCHDALNRFTCTCAAGYNGKNCETDINECASNPCQHGGVCHDVVNRFTCTCPPGYSGKKCETDINECASNPCRHGGVCHDAVNRFTCTCAAGYSGKHCETDIDECASNPCQHGGVCHDAAHMFTCTCTAGYSGKNCETVDECISNPCQNKGVCTDRINGYTCNCLIGYGGINCEYDISECHSSPCVNGGVCNDMVNGYNCSCPRGYTGRHCQTAPTIKIAPKIYLDEQKTVNEGTDVFYIPCFAEGIPLPTITWESIDKQSLPINSRQLADFLIFENVTTDDSGLYMCTAKNEIGTEIKVVHVIVKAKPKKLHTAPLIYALSMVQVSYYEDAYLVCNVTGYPTPSITWKYNNKMLPSSRNVLSVHNVTNTTSGYYTCIATNDAGTSQANILLKVTHDVPKIVIPPKTAVIMTGHSHNFTCIATGHPPPSVKWSFKSFTQQSTTMPSHQLHQHGSLLTLFAIKTHESGTLSCTAQNEFGDDKASISVIFRNPSTSGLG